MFDWPRILPDSDFRFRIGLRKSEGLAFFRPEAGRDERMKWRRTSLDAHPGRYAGALPGSEGAIDEAGRWMDPAGPSSAAGSPFERCLDLGRQLDCDWVLLSGDAESHHPMIAGCVCFPSHWSVPGKLGQPIEVVHEPVPTLDGPLQGAIHTFLSRLQPGAGWERDNWGLAAEARLDLHPATAPQPLGADPALDATWLRLERQYLTRLAETGAILFAIKVTAHRLDDLLACPGVASGLGRALRSMPDDIAGYKGLRDCRERLADRLERGG
jgi:hypothetical protein